ncbi:MAG: single-stranded-DNA-specific exonuclease RecJ [Ruthenibacterium sp.]
MFYRPWQINRPEPAAAQALAAQTQLPRLVCEVLLSRGVASAAEVQDILGQGQTLSSPMCMKNMDAAAQRILRAVDGGERIVVFGDYDVDGVTATAMLYTYLDSVGAEVYYKLPSRADDGYGLFPDIVEQMAAKNVTLIITVDNGVSANEAIARANELGVDVVVTDHHLPPEVLPDAAAIVDPQLPEDDSPCKTLCGAGVAFKLICALEDCTPEELLPFYGDLAAIGTIADIMVLAGENRMIVKEGLKMLRHTDRPGLAALIESCGFAGKELTAENVSFGLSPRLNAAGRMDNAAAALELLLCEDIDEAQQRVQALEEQNAARQKAEQDITQSVLEAIAADDSYQADKILIVAGEGYHQGVIGIVASRIVERFGKPTIIISIDENGEGKGSGRSLEGISLYHAIAACEDLLLRYGGHAMAAGLSVTRDNIPALRKRMNEWAAKEHPTLRHAALVLDAPVTLAATSEADVNGLDVLAPFGHGNPPPLFLLENAVIEAVYPVSDGKHSRLRLRQGSTSLYAVLFGQSPKALCYAQGDTVDAALSLSVYEGKNGPMLSGRVKELRPAGLDDAYLDSAELYEAFCCGAVLSQSQLALLRPAREDTIAVYRAVQSGVKAADLRPLFAKLGVHRAGKALVSLQALTELGLMEQREEAQGATLYVAVPNAPKRNLTDAPVLHQLEEQYASANV